MRMQSIFMLPPGNEERTAAIVKESGKNKNKVYLNAEQWKQYNAKYGQASCKLADDTALVSGYACNKAVMTLADGKIITAWFTRRIQRTEPALVEPVFACIPGLGAEIYVRIQKGKDYLYCYLDQQKADRPGYPQGTFKRLHRTALPTGG